MLNQYLNKIILCLLCCSLQATVCTVSLPAGITNLYLRVTKISLCSSLFRKTLLSIKTQQKIMFDVPHNHPKKSLLYWHISHHIILKHFNITTQTKLPPDNQQQENRGQFPETYFQVAGIIYRPTWSLSHLQHHRVSPYLVTEASIILLLCIPVERAWASVTGHSLFRLTSKHTGCFHLWVWGWCPLFVFKIKRTLETVPPRPM